MMNINVSLSPEAETKLREQAQAAGKDVASFVLEALEEKLSLADVNTRGNGNLSAQQRIAELRAWAASHPHLPYEADDNRESIYEGRGE